MKAYPMEGSTQVIDGILTVNMIYRQVVIKQAGDRTVLLNYVDHAPTDKAASYAWYVFRDGEQIAELGRGYEEKPEYLLELPGDGSYTFRGFCQRGDFKKSVNGITVTVENGVIVPQESLEQIDPEEAALLVKPAVEVSVTVYGERAVKLTMIDNYLEPGLEYTYAWYVYRNGERMREYDRWYSADPEYDLILAEDGEYRFKLFLRVGGVGKGGFMSKTITIGEAQNNENAA